MLDQIRKCFQDGRIIWRQHALSRMLEREISRADVQLTIDEGELIETYPETHPYPTYLVLGYSRGQPLHVVLALDSSKETAYIITAYIPSTAHFSDDFKTRKRGEQ